MSEQSCTEQLSYQAKSRKVYRVAFSQITVACWAGQLTREVLLLYRRDEWSSESVRDEYIANTPTVFYVLAISVLDAFEKARLQLIKYLGDSQYSEIVARYPKADIYYTVQDWETLDEFVHTPNSGVARKSSTLKKEDIYSLLYGANPFYFGSDEEFAMTAFRKYLKEREY